MYKILLALLVAKFQGVRKDGLDAMARALALHCKSEDDAKTLVEELDKAQVDEFVKDYRAGVDKEVSDGVKTNETKLRSKYNFIEKTKVEPGNDGNGDDGKDGNNGKDDIAAQIKAAVDAALSPLKTQLDSLNAAEVSKARLAKLNEKLATCKDDAFKAKALKDYSRMHFDNDDAFNEYITETETDINNANQRVANEALGGGNAPVFNAKDNDGVSKAVADFVAENKPDAKGSFAGKEL